VLRLLRFERRWLVRVCETILPPGDGPDLPRGAAAVPMGRFVDDFVVHAPLLSMLGLRAALWMLMLAPVFLLGRCQAFLDLPHGERVTLLDRLRRSNSYLVRESMLLIKLVACLGFCGLAAVQEPLGIYPTDETPPTWARKAPW
jgi:hypothetical protein